MESLIWSGAIMISVIEIIHCYISLDQISSCGVDRSPMTEVYDGWAEIEHYPWMGYLIYPSDLSRQYTTAVVLVTRQIVIAAASEIDRLPKTDFRLVTKVVLGGNCSGPQIGIKEYTYHPEYRTNMFNELALIQLDVDNIEQELSPICPPPTHFTNNPSFYAMSFGEDCKDSRIQIHRMNYVNMKECRRFYRRNGIDMDTMWPKYTACAKAVHTQSQCVWRSGTALVMRQGDRWLLLGFGVYGPGCSSPARFVDYGMYHGWVKNSILRIGRPAITRMGASNIVMRKTKSSLQRFGPCDVEEVRTEIYTDTMDITFPYIEYGHWKTAIYNVTLYTQVEYSCIIFKAKYLGGAMPVNYQKIPPKIRLKRWCAGPTGMCYDYQHLTIDFFVEISFAHSVLFKMSAYGRTPRILDPRRVYKHLNKSVKQFPDLPNVDPAPSSYG